MRGISFLFLLVAASLAVGAAPTTIEHPTITTQPQGEAPEASERIHRLIAIAEKTQLVNDLTAANKKALEDGDTAEIERIDSALTKAKKDLKELVSQDKKIETAAAANSGSITKPSAQDPQKIIFVCDATGSMVAKFPTVKTELTRMVQELKPFQFFDIVFYQDEVVHELDDDVILASPDNQQKAQKWLEHIVSGGTTDPIPALTFALKLKPDLMYFLTDAADFPDVPAVRQTFRDLNSDHKIRVNTILFVESEEEQETNKESEPLMRGIASDNGGTFKGVRMDHLK